MFGAKESGQRERLGFSTFTVLNEAKRDEGERGKEGSGYEKRR